MSAKAESHSESYSFTALDEHVEAHISLNLSAFAKALHRLMAQDEAQAQQIQDLREEVNRLKQGGNHSDQLSELRMAFAELKERVDSNEAVRQQEMSDLADSAKQRCDANHERTLRLLMRLDEEVVSDRVTSPVGSAPGTFEPYPVPVGNLRRTFQLAQDVAQENEKLRKDIVHLQSRSQLLQEQKLDKGDFDGFVRGFHDFENKTNNTLETNSLLLAEIDPLRNRMGQFEGAVDHLRKTKADNASFEQKADASALQSVAMHVTNLRDDVNELYAARAKPGSGLTKSNSTSFERRSSIKSNMPPVNLDDIKARLGQLELNDTRLEQVKADRQELYKLAEAFDALNARFASSAVKPPPTQPPTQTFETIIKSSPNIKPLSPQQIADSESTTTRSFPQPSADFPSLNNTITPISPQVCQHSFSSDQMIQSRPSTGQGGRPPTSGRSAVCNNCGGAIKRSESVSRGVKRPTSASSSQQMAMLMNALSHGHDHGQLSIGSFQPTHTQGYSPGRIGSNWSHCCRCCCMESQQQVTPSVVTHSSASPSSRPNTSRSGACTTSNLPSVRDGRPVTSPPRYVAAGGSSLPVRCSDGCSTTSAHIAGSVNNGVVYDKNYLP